MTSKLAVFALLAGAVPLAAQQPSTPDTAAPSAAMVHDCLNKCPAGVRPPAFATFPQMVFEDADVRGRTTRMRSYLTFQAVIGTDGVIEPESLQLSGGTARSAEGEVRRGLTQARFRPGELDGKPVRARVSLRFEFEAEGVNWVKYTYRVTAK